MKTNKTFSKLMQTHIQETKNFKARVHTEFRSFIEKVGLNIFSSSNFVSIYVCWVCATYAQNTFFLRSCLNDI
jgi:hypothetical protein